MGSVPAAPAVPAPTNAAPLPRLFAYAQALGLEAHLYRARRGVGTLALALVWLTLAWRGTGRPERLPQLDEPLLAALLDRARLPGPATLRRSLGAFSTKGVREAVEAAYRAELPRRPGRVWAALDAHQVPYWGRAERDRFGKGWSGNHSRRLRGYRLYLAVDTSTGQVITYVLAPGRTRDARMAAVLARRVRHVLGRRLAGVVADCGFTSRRSVAALVASGVPFILGFGRSAAVKAHLGTLSRQQRVALRDGGAIRLGACPWDPRLRLFALGARTPGDRRGPWVYVTSLRSYGPRRLATTYRQRNRVEQAIEELLNGNDLDHLVTYRLRPNRVALGFRLLARNLAIGLQIRAAGARPTVIREPAAFRAAHVDGLGIFARERRTLRVIRAVATYRGRRRAPQRLRLPWSSLAVHLVHSP
jgi:Transposase DDE domain